MALISKRFLVFTISGGIVLGFFFYLCSFSFYNQVQDNSSLLGRVFHGRPILLQSLYWVHRQIDISKINYSRIYDKRSDAINLELSAADLVDMNTSIESAIERSFFLDEDKRWRKGAVWFGDTRVKNVQIKIHGTSVSPLVKSIEDGYSTFKAGLSSNRYSLAWQKGGVSLRVKLPRESYHELVRRFELRSLYDEWDASTIAFNRFAYNQGLISPKMNLRQMYINGSDVGVVLMSESMAKEFLERDFGLTNYAEIKSNDVWDKSYRTSHISATDFYFGDKEAAGGQEAAMHGLGALKRLFESIENNDVAAVKKMVDLGDLATISALQLLYGRNHSTAGDNFRYVYDFSSGIFRFPFRVEGPVRELNPQKLQDWNGQTIFDWKSNELMATLLGDAEFLRLRNDKLAILFHGAEQLVKTFEDSMQQMLELENKTGISLRSKVFSSQRSLEKLLQNLEGIREYLEYQKVYATYDLSSNRLLVLNESVAPVTLRSHFLCGQSDEPIGSTEHSVLGNQLLDMTYSTFDLNLPSADCALFLDGPSGTDLYLNYLKNSVPAVFDNDYREQHLAGDSSIDVVDNAIIFRSGGRFRFDRTVMFPEGVNVVIEAGVKLYLANDVSVLINGNLTALGELEAPVEILRSSDSSFGTFAVLGSRDDRRRVSLVNFQIGGGSEDVVAGVYFSGQLALHHVDVEIINSKIFGSESDDGLNAKYCGILLKSSEFSENYGDQVDLDFCSGRVEDNYFYVSDGSKVGETDGLDVSGSSVTIVRNEFRGFSDKGISVGENSEVRISNNRIQDSRLGIAVKDGSNAHLADNVFYRNQIDVDTYIKKGFYKPPEIRDSRSE